jgi:hypothetical protein
VRLSTLDFSGQDLPIAVPRRRVSAALRRSRPYTRPMNRDRIETPDDLTDVWIALQQEAYFQIAINKHISLCLRHGWEIIGTEPQFVEYVRQRLLDMVAVSGISTPQLVRSVIRNVVLYSNAFLAKVRDDERSVGRTMKIDGKPRKPVAAYFPQNPRVISAEKNKWGKLVAFRDGDAEEGRLDVLIRQMVGNGATVKEQGVTVYPTHDMVHFAYNREDGYVFGRPLWSPAIEDINSLRRMEEDVEHLVRENSFPKTHYTVGDDQDPATPEELEQRRQELISMEAGETFVTGHREAFEVIATNRGVDPTGALEHFEERVFSGLNISGVELGRGGTVNRGTASNIMQQRVETCKDFQAIVEEFILTQMIWELMAEHPENPRIKRGELEKMVAFKFNEIDTDAEIARVTHWVDQYNKNAITRAEMREELGYDPTVDDADFMVDNVTVKVAQAKVTAQQTRPDTVNHPTNQHGTKISNGSQQNDAITDGAPEMSVAVVDDQPALPTALANSIDVDDLPAVEAGMLAEWRGLIQDLARNIHEDWSDMEVVRPLLQVGLLKAALPHLSTIASEDVVHIVSAKFLERDLLKSVEDSVDAIEEATVIALESLRRNIGFECRELLRKAHAIERARRGVHVVRSRDDSCASQDGQILPNSLYVTVPPHHDSCRCTLETVSTDHSPRMDPVPTVSDLVTTWIPDRWVNDAISFPEFGDLSEALHFLGAYFMDHRN